MPVTSDTMIQLALRSDDTHMVCWVPFDPRLEEPDIEITLKDIPNVRWKVEQVYKTMRTRAAIHRNWPVGGIRKPNASTN